jgi:hypothetical protein
MPLSSLREFGCLPLHIGSFPKWAARHSLRTSLLLAEWYKRLIRSGPITHDFVQEAQAVSIVMQEQEDTKKRNRETTGDVKVQPVPTTELED